MCRPLSEEELRVHTPVVISCNEGRREVSAIQNIANKQIDRTFAFDKVWFSYFVLFCLAKEKVRKIRENEMLNVLWFQKISGDKSSIQHSQQPTKHN